MVKKATQFIEEILHVEDEIPELHRKLKLVLRILRDEVLIDGNRFEEIIDKVLPIVTLDKSTTYGRNESNKFSALLTNLLETKNYRDLLFSRLKKIIENHQNETLTRFAINNLVSNSDIDEIKEYLCELIQNNYSEYKDYFFTPNVISLVAPITNTETYKKHYIKYLNNNELELETGLLGLNFSFIFLPESVKKNDLFDFESEQVVESYIDALKKIKNKNTRQKLSDTVIGLFVLRDNLQKYKEKIKEHDLNFDFSEINKKIKKDKATSYLGIPICKFVDFEIFRIPNRNDKVAFLFKGEEYEVEQTEIPIKKSIKNRVNSLYENSSDAERYYDLQISFFRLIHPMMSDSNQTLSKKWTY